MCETDRQKHWENVYETKDTTRVGWYQQKPIISLEFLDFLEIKKTDKILDAGGGDSLLVDFMVLSGYQNITVLDISAAAIRNSKIRLGSLAAQVHWIVDDLSSCHLDQKFDVWHDRAAFHFLNKEREQKHYLDLVRNVVNPGGYLIMGTFSEIGPTTCSGLQVTQYSVGSLKEFFSEFFTPIKCLNTDHITPGGIEHNYSFCAFQKK